MARRKIVGLESAEWCQQPRFAVSVKGAKGSRKRGLAFERRVQDELTAIYSGSADVFCNRWISFVDAAGDGIASPDCVIIPHDSAKPLVIVECKLTWRRRAKEKLASVYGVLLRQIYPDREQRHAQICRRLTLACPDDICHELDGLTARAAKYTMIHLAF